MLPQEKAVPELSKLITKIGKNDFVGRFIWFDPGETTGYAVFRRNAQETYLVGQGQLKTWPIEDAVKSFQAVIGAFGPVERVGFESYHIYNWKLNQHSFQEVPTLQIIGCLKTLCIIRLYPYISQNAQTGKGFCSDDKLKHWGVYDQGLRHAMDATRHACHFLLFGSKEDNG